MLFFRSEEHITTWYQSDTPPGAVLTLETQWELARIWYADRASPQWRRRTPEEAEAVFDGIGLIGDFWRLTPPG